MVKSAYAAKRAPAPRVRLPRLEDRLSSSPMIASLGKTTASLPVPKVSPTAMRRQNSHVAHRKGMQPATNTATSEPETWGTPSEDAAAAAAAAAASASAAADGGGNTAAREAKPAAA
eukprot:TRINITY_DN12906_c0_g1_i1.p3 TRINITY_DN12906_c0_g1~~TRINITY_DN12906_c0_g1_i1.p3  ORF type:complete len:117 (+),score=16.74 TRINITY_DN12906_c0_g1_i1:221-571(+)